MMEPAVLFIAWVLVVSAAPDAIWMEAACQTKDESAILYSAPATVVINGRSTTVLQLTCLTPPEPEPEPTPKT